MCTQGVRSGLIGMHIANVPILACTLVDGVAVYDGLLGSGGRDVLVNRPKQTGP